MMSPKATLLESRDRGARLTPAADAARYPRAMAKDPPRRPAPAASPFAGLEALRSSLPAGPAPASTTPAAPAAPKGPARAVVRMERKGRGGKEVTVVDKLGLRPTELETWCRDLKHALGCGGSVDGELIVLQGDLRSRLPAVLTAHGVIKVTVG
jgi:translation initiation factor 1